MARKLSVSPSQDRIPFPRPPQPGARVSLRVVEASSESLAVVRGVLQPPALATDRGAMLTVRIDGEVGYCATADLSAAGLREAAACAAQWAQAAAGSHGTLLGLEQHPEARARNVLERPEVDVARRGDGIEEPQGLVALRRIEASLKKKHTQTTHPNLEHRSPTPAIS